MLSSNVGVTMGTHLCGGMAVKTALMLGHSDLDCGMEQMEMDCVNSPEQGAATLTKSKCCDNHYTSVESDDAVFSKTSLGSVNFEFLVAFAYTYAGIDLFVQDNSTPYTYYSPPLLKQDRPVLFQSFLL